MSDVVTYRTRSGSLVTSSRALRAKVLGTDPTSLADAVDVVDDRPAGNASTDDWRTYRLAHGYTVDEVDGLGRDGLRDLEDR